MSPDDETLYADMREAIRGDRERAARRAKDRGTVTPAPPPAQPPPPAPEPRRFAGVRRLFGDRRDPG